jgi:hypothetical protein
MSLCNCWHVEPFVAQSQTLRECYKVVMNLVNNDGANTARLEQVLKLMETDAVVNGEVEVATP